MVKIKHLGFIEAKLVLDKEPPNGYSVFECFILEDKKRRLIDYVNTRMSESKW